MKFKPQPTQNPRIIIHFFRASIIQEKLFRPVPFCMFLLKKG